ncbi:MAG: diacylglycerol kinase [Coriobacteriales bacterium]|jgi:diacylglycerol kinase family enzyme|nr:diacylglycerol kinase [Coriobacteriales bacterium]
MDILIINNLSSGLRDGAIYEFVRKLVCDGDRIMMRCTDGHTPIGEMLNDARSFDLVVASGSDSMIAAVCYELRNSGVAILPFPAGTSNLLATNLDMPDEPGAIAALAREHLALDFDLAEISYEQGGSVQTRGFAIIAGAGYDATIMETARQLKEALGPGAYIASAFANPNPRLSHFTVTLDDKTIETDAIAVLLLNFAKIYPDISITHGNNARDGLLEVAIIKPQNTVELLPAFIAAFRDRSGGFPSRTDAIETYRTHTVRVESEQLLHIQHDGEALGASTPLEAHILPGATRLIVSREALERLSV